ncbi:signal transduction histidine kinase [Breznakia sp. PF5-3]|uniref:HAMP domain-containing sensor histidine kinase n=1 Tax=unclassified Breznakia TaxID=2623764 RepID=UPI0024070E22|nr:MULTISPECIES: HAMP domain-containing sensor histidine kinase [unclassified Breznakia]MDF9824822.1 signal transduction histidine kinase [Breznakia sp. PM6-1]MDF9835216.1 signal transduction histidine kinase [Breznakia sp. PF5-3]
MNNKKRGRTFLKIYLAFLTSIISFFTIYAFRFDVLQLSESDENSSIVDEVKIKRLNQKLYEINLNVDNNDKILSILQSELENYNYQVLMRSDNDEIAIPITKFESMIYNNKLSQGQFELLHFKNGDAYIEIYPTFKSYFSIYVIVDFIISILIFIICYFLFNYIDKKQLINKATQKLQNTRFGKRLSVELIGVNLLAVAIAISAYLFMYNNRYAYFSFIRDNVAENTNMKIADELQDMFKDVNINEKTYNKINNSLNNSFDSHTTVTLMDEKKPEMYLSTFYSYELYSSNNLYDVSAISSANSSTHTIKFKNKKIFAFISTSPVAPYAPSYLYTIIFIAISLYAITLIWFIQNKVKMILKLQEDVDILAAGNLTHEISILGGDEIGELGKNLNEMRISFYETMESENRMQDANKKLITSMSHDLRTPLTSLMGYLDILRLQKGDPKQSQVYLDKAAEKVEQIRSLSDQMFEYFLVYGQDENANLTLQSCEEWINYIEESVNLLKYQDYKIKMELERSGLLRLNMTLMKRAMDNIFSNLQKYADITSPITIISEIKKGHYCLLVENSKRKDIDDIESNHIGLKSVDRIIKLHNGTIKIKNTEQHFLILIELPMIV